ncbi:ATP-binding protein [Paenibacillus sp. FSL L8-0436]|uniref:ATP-binding protein n=1 Tax=Paenibacillus sp. FSL L8-0436 TaxID=2954686 RepID=UPI003159607E
MVQNLIRNCVTHSDGAVEIQILAGQQAAIVFRNPVKDATAIDIQRIFERFYTADQARGATTGLGLSIVRLLAEQSGGSTSASIQDGVLEIRVELPLYM